MNAAEKLAKGIIANYNNQSQSNTIDLPGHVESLLQSLGATTSDSGGKVTYPEVRSPIMALIPSRRIDCHMDLSAQSRSRPRRS
jgi:hypothetical protein